MDSFNKEVDLPTTRFEQQTSYYCGPASCQMFLSLPKYSINIVQSNAYEEIQKLNTESNFFFSDPDGVSGYINEEIPAQLLNKKVDVCETDTYEDAISQVNFTINVLGLPSPILVQGGAHWIIINGLRFSLKADETKEITAFRVQDPSKNSPTTDGYIFPTEFQLKFTPNTFGTKWKNKFVVLSQKTDGKLLTLQDKSLLLRGGGGDIEESVKLSLMSNGFDNVDVVGKKGGGASLISTISVQDLDGISDYKLVPIDATQNKQFKDFIYVAISDNDNSLLEAATLSSALNVFSDEEMRQHLQSLFPNQKIEVGGYIWKRSFELRSRLSVARPFKVDGIDKILLPDGRAVDQLTQFSKGGS